MQWEFTYCDGDHQSTTTAAPPISCAAALRRANRLATKKMLMLTLPALVFLVSSGERDRDCCSLKHVLIDHEPFLLCTDAQSLPCSVDSGGVCPDVVCPGDVVTYICDVTSVVGSTVWRLPAGTCTDTDDAIGLTQTTGCSAATGACGPFEAANQPDVGGQCLVSTLTVTASLDISNSLIQCSNDPTPGDAVLVGNATLLVAG